MKRFKATWDNLFHKNSFSHYHEELPFRLVLSLTTSPSRLLTSLPQVLKQMNHLTLDIYVVIPKLFRNKEKYPTSKNSLTKSTNQEFVIIEKDLGPITKILPILEKFQDDLETVVVSLDDDILYNPKDIVALAKTAYETKTVSTGFARFDSNLNIWIPFGSDAIAYPIHEKTSAFVQTCYSLLDKNPKCRLHDDMILAYAAFLHDFPIPLQQKVERKFLIQSFDDNALMYEFPNKDEECSFQLISI